MRRKISFGFLPVLLCLIGLLPGLAPAGEGIRLFDDKVVIHGKVSEQWMMRTHNLQLDVTIAHESLTVITGVSGSGKSSLAFDTLYAEGQRRYVESLSSYARQFLGQMEKPKVDYIGGLSPAIAIEQKSVSKNPRSTVGTITEVYDYLRVLFARIGEQFCIGCGRRVGHGNAQEMVEQIASFAPDSKILLLAPIVENRKGEHRDRLKALIKEGYARVRIDGVVQAIEDVQRLAKHKKHTIEVVVDRLIIKPAKTFRKRLTDSVETTLKLGQGRLIVHQQVAGTGPDKDLDPRHVGRAVQLVGRDVVAHHVSTVVREPQIAGSRMPVEAD